MRRAALAGCEQLLQRVAGEVEGAEGRQGAAGDRGGHQLQAVPGEIQGQQGGEAEAECWHVLQLVTAEEQGVEAPDGSERPAGDVGDPVMGEVQQTQLGKAAEGGRAEGG